MGVRDGRRRDPPAALSIRGSCASKSEVALTEKLNRAVKMFLTHGTKYVCKLLRNERLPAGFLQVALEVEMQERKRTSVIRRLNECLSYMGKPCGYSIL